MIDATYLDELRARIPVSTVVGRRVQLRKVGHEWRGLSPFNKERTPSFFVNDQKGFYHDFSSGKHGDIFAFVMDTEGLDFRQAVEQIAALAGVSLPDGETPAAAPVPRQQKEAKAERELDDDERDRQHRALAIWEGAGDIAGTLAARYLTGRKLVLSEGVSGHVLRFHPACPFEDRRGPALIALYRDIRTDEPRAIHRRALTPDARKIGKPLALGPKGACAVKLADHADIEQGLHVGEGIETTIAGMMLGFAPAWALGDTGNLRVFPVFGGVDALTILVDNDANQAGQAAASECFDRWTAAGREVWCVTPDCVGADINDVLGDQK
jgi:putative DNA primase/helicase